MEKITMNNKELENLIKKDNLIMKMFDLGNGHTITVEKANRGIEDDYRVVFYEDGRKLDDEYGNKEYIEYEYGVKI